MEFGAEARHGRVAVHFRVVLNPRFNLRLKSPHMHTRTSLQDI